MICSVPPATRGQHHSMSPVLRAMQCGPACQSAQRLLQSMVLLDQVGPLLADHDRRRIRIPAASHNQTFGAVWWGTKIQTGHFAAAPDHPRHDGSIDHSQFIDPYVACYVSHVACRISHVACRMSHIACRMSHVACQMSHVACCTDHFELGCAHRVIIKLVQVLVATHCTCSHLHVACCMLHVACCTTHVAWCLHTE